MIKNLQKALREYFFDENTKDKEMVDSVAKILYNCSKNDDLTYKKIENLTKKKDLTDLMFFINENKLLIPKESFSKTMEWDDRTFLNISDETFEIPNVIKHLVTEALHSGFWNNEKAIIKTFKQIGDPNYKTMPILVKKLYQYSKNYHISGTQIKRLCEELLLDDKVNSLISELKGSGVMSPKLTSSLFQSVKQKSPIYKLNPSLFKNETEN
jgi:hypothetical protein